MNPPMKSKRLRITAMMIALAALASLGESVNEARAQGSQSLRLVIRCNTDGSYDCANINCNGQFCCTQPGDINVN
jgi:hypothetical protein